LPVNSTELRTQLMLTYGTPDSRSQDIEFGRILEEGEQRIKQSTNRRKLISNWMTYHAEIVLIAALELNERKFFKDQRIRKIQIWNGDNESLTATICISHKPVIAKRILGKIAETEQNELAGLTQEQAKSRKIMRRQMTLIALDQSQYLHSLMIEVLNHLIETLKDQTDTFIEQNSITVQATKRFIGGTQEFSYSFTVRHQKFDVELPKEDKSSHFITDEGDPPRLDIF